MGTIGYEEFKKAYLQCNDYIGACFLIGVHGYIRTKKFDELKDVELRQLRYRAIRYIIMGKEQFNDDFFINDYKKAKNFEKIADGGFKLSGFMSDSDISPEEVGTAKEVEKFLFNKMRYYDQFPEDEKKTRLGISCAINLLKHFDNNPQESALDTNFGINVMIGRPKLKELIDN